MIPLTITPFAMDTTMCYSFLVKNLYQIKGRTTLIFLRGKHVDKYPHTLIDTSDLTLLIDRTWNVDIYGYVRGKNKRIHQIILGDRPPLVIDHKNGKRWDNRRKNLRHTTESVNCGNRKSLGIYYDKKRRKWMAHIRVNYIKKNLGRYDSAEKALLARARAVAKYFPI